MPGCAVGGWNTLWICRGRLDDAGASPTTPQGLQQQTSFSIREEDLGNFSAGSMKQREHLDEATVACWVTFCAEAIRSRLLIVALHFGAVAKTDTDLAGLIRHSLDAVGRTEGTALTAF